MIYDAIVIGLGGMGSAASYYLSDRGLSVLGLEQFSIGHDFGSSHGVNRIIRLAYAEGSGYVPMLRRAYYLWRQIERTAGEQLLYVTGGIDAGPENGAIISGSLRSCREHRLKHELLNADELHRRFPGYALPKELVAVHQPDAGFVLSERAIIAYVVAALSRGAEIHGHERVRSWHERKGLVSVRTTKNLYQARRLVITAGPWASKMVPFLRRPRLAVPERQVMIWTQPKRPAHFRVGAFPIFNMEARESRRVVRYYGFPIFGVPGFKLGRYHHLGENVDPDRMDRECHPRDEHVLRTAIRRYFPDADGPTLAMKTCLFTNSPDEHFVIGRHPGCSRVVVAAGFSGHGFKFASVVGEALADIALDGASARFDLGIFALERPRTAVGMDPHSVPAGSERTARIGNE
jgi:sarcosine oxidase